jgi:hypothetical protein
MYVVVGGGRHEACPYVVGEGCGRKIFRPYVDAYGYVLLHGMVECVQAES